MPRADLEAYREYQRAYQREYKREQRAERRAARSLHRELGIETYVHMQAVLHVPLGGFQREQVNAHWFRMPITLAKVWDKNELSEKA